VSSTVNRPSKSPSAIIRKIRFLKRARACRAAAGSATAASAPLLDSDETRAETRFPDGAFAPALCPRLSRCLEKSEARTDDGSKQILAYKSVAVKEHAKRKNDAHSGSMV